jgi:hypothetical protein
MPNVQAGARAQRKESCAGKADASGGAGLQEGGVTTERKYLCNLCRIPVEPQDNEEAK